ncbi:OmpA family protein [Cereibacter johrii]|uniref:OmpA family protein n=1 Tax=Cereibacter johrii TaxID=445629 RepID=UPI002B262873|nr:OmpA family protein [Cereibacter johrii]MEA5159813.1 OmpA family protein [Cereibacter johrii]
MRAAARGRVHDEKEEESAFVSMTDMTVSFLFIVMILLAFFAARAKDDDTVSRRSYDEMVEQRDQAEAQVQSLTAQLADALEQLVRVRDDLRHTEAERDAARTEVARLEVLLATLQKDLDNAQEANLRLTDEVMRLQRILDRLNPKNPLETYLAEAAAARLHILQVLRDRILIDFPDLQVEISAESDALRFQGEGLFKTGSAALPSDKRQIVETIAGRLDDILPCYTLGTQRNWQVACNPSLAVIEAVQIEGHTDSDGDDLSNLTLSTARANATFAAMIASRANLVGHLNTRAQPVLSVAGYGEMRPVALNDSKANKSTNRRIDLRIIMHTPGSSEEIERIRSQLEVP